MKNSNLNNEYLDDEIDLIEILRNLYSSKKLIILITLASALLAYIYLAQKEVQYQSTVFIEIGSYDLLNGKRKLIEPVSSLINKLKINQISKNLITLNLSSIEDHFLKINYTSPSPKLNEKLINEAITFVQESNGEILDTIVNNDIELIRTIDNKIYTLESKNKFLSKLISEEKNNLLKFQFYEQTLNIQNLIQNFKQEKDNLDLQTKLISDQTNTTRPIREIKTTKIKTNSLIIILIGTFLGFIFSVFIAFIRQFFFQEQN